MGVLGTLDAATAREKSVKIITNAALRAEWEAATAALDEAAKSDAKHASLSGALPATTAAIDALEEIRAKVMDSEVEFVFAPLAWTEHVKLQASFPPILGNPIHARRGYNVELFTDAMIRASCTRVVGVDGDVVTEIPASTWDSLLGSPARPAVEDAPARPAVVGSLNMGAVNELATAAFDANDGTTSVPPSARSLLESQDSGASSTPHKPGTSAPVGSEGGSRPTSPRSSATKKATRKPGKSDAS